MRTKQLNQILAIKLKNCEQTKVNLQEIRLKLTIISDLTSTIYQYLL